MKQLMLTTALFLAAAFLCSDPVIMEAEHGTDIKPNFEIKSNANASGKLAIHYGEGAGGLFGIHSHTDQELEIGTALYPFLAEQDGLYHFGARVFWMDKCGNQIRAALDGGPMFKIRSRDREKHTFKKWYWAVSEAFRVKKGRHLLKLIADEDGPWIDQVCVYRQGETKPSGITKTNWPLKVSDDSARPVSISFSKKTQVIGPENTFAATLWLRNLTAGTPTLTVSAKTPEDVLLTTDKEKLNVQFRDGQLLEPIKLLFKAEPGLSRSEKAVTVQVSDSSGKVCTAGRTLFFKPYDWYIAGPLPAQMHAEDSLELGKTVNLLEPVSNDEGKDVSWKKLSVNAYNPFQTIDFEYLYGPSVSKTAYLYTEIHAPAEKRYLFLINHDGATDIWIDGKNVYQEHWHHPAMGWLRQRYVALSKGRHRILVRSQQNGKPDNDYQKNYWLFRLRIRENTRKISEVRGLECVKEKQ